MHKNSQLLGTVCQGCHRVLLRGRFLSTEAFPTRVTTDVKDHNYRKPKHFYTSGYVPWNTRNELTQHLQDNILFNNDDYIAFNKPPGIPMTVNKENPPIIQKQSVKHREIPEFATLSMEESFGDLSKKISFNKNPRLGLPNYRLNSGIVIYTKNTAAHEKLTTWWRNTRANKIFSIKYWALTLGLPDPKLCSSGQDVFYIQTRKDQSSIMKYESLQSTPRYKRKKGKVIQSSVKHKILAANRDLKVALVEVQPTWSVNDMVPLYLTHRRSPILGDHIYSHLVTTVSGVPMLMAPSVKEETPQKLQPEFLRALGFKKQDRIHVPLHLHLAQAVIPVIGKKNSYHTINAPLPQMFLESLKRLGIEYTKEPDIVSLDDLKKHNLYEPHKR